MRILVVHQNYLMTGQSGGSRFNEMAHSWSEAGHHVTVIAGMVDYCTGQKSPRYRGRWIAREQDGDVSVWRCHVPSAYGRGYLGRMWAFFAFTVSASAAALAVDKPDVVIATSPPLIVAIPGWILTRLRGRRTPYIFEVRDLWPESAITTGVLGAKSLITRALYALERWATKVADHIVVLTPAFEKDIVRRGLASAAKISCVPNGADLNLFATMRDTAGVREELGWGDRFVVLYAGAHGRANALHQLVDAAAALQDRPDILIASVGDGPERPALQQEVASRGLTNIRFYGARPKDAMPSMIGACDVGAAVLQNNPTFHTVYPNKVFDYMACGKPVLLGIDGVARKLVCEDARAGVFAQPEDGPALAHAIRRLADDPAVASRLGHQGHEWVTANASRKALSEKYLGILEGLASDTPPMPVYAACKRALDVTLASLLLILSLPVLAIAMLLIRLTMRAKPVFRQTRAGFRGQLFASYKLRTMTDARDATGALLPDEKRLTPLGRVLRATSLDELPQLWNVLKGDMSLVGPRPLLARYLPRYSARQQRRHDAKPGITGWAQIHGRNTVNWEDRFELDLWYVKNRGMRLDIKILAATFWTVVKQDGISQRGHATMPEFLGSDAQAAQSAGKL